MKQLLTIMVFVFALVLTQSAKAEESRMERFAKFTQRLKDNNVVKGGIHFVTDHMKNNGVPAEKCFTVSFAIIDDIDNNVLFDVNPPNVEVMKALNRHMKPHIRIVMGTQSVRERELVGYTRDSWIKCLRWTTPTHKLDTTTTNPDYRSLASRKLAANIDQNPNLLKVAEYMAENGVPPNCRFNVALEIAYGEIMFIIYNEERDVLIEMNMISVKQKILTALNIYIKPQIALAIGKNYKGTVVINNWIENLHWEE